MIEIECPKCGERMEEAYGGERRLGEVVTVEYICPRCLYVEKIAGIVVREDRRR